EDEWFINNLDRVLDKMPNYEGDVTRSLYFYNKESLEAFLIEHEIGKTIQYSEFISTTKGKTYNPEGQEEIYIFNSKNGKNISMYNEKEEEVLYRRNSKFEIIELEEMNGKYYILMEERNG
ncbi:hypothetical protein, partial [Clostridioides difficile]|uniref:hypothetical protein n=1 Tax=Clostridioides difficile TaxID=1496 RepID=UPI002ED304A3